MSGRRAALRIARRDVWRARGRSLLILAMVALPVAGAAFADVAARTTSVTGAERLPLQMGGAADARLLPQQTGEPVIQPPDATLVTGPGTGADGGRAAPPVDAAGLLPAGSRWITDAGTEVTVHTTDGLARTRFRELLYTDPVAAGMIRQVSGRAPATDGEVVVSRSLLRTLGLAVGDRMQTDAPDRSFTIVGIVRAPSDGQGTALAVGRPGALVTAAQALRGDGSAPDLLADTPAPVSWAQVLAANARGVGVLSRAVVQHPPARAAVPYYRDAAYGSQGPVDATAIGAVALVVGLAVVEVALLAGAAFAVGARRQSRALGLLAATGGTAGQVRDVVLAQGLLLGVAGGLAGVGLGVGSALVALPIVAARFDRVLPAVDLRPLELLALTAVGVVTGLLAALVPARAAARQDVLVALRGRRGEPGRPRRRFGLLGAVIAVTGVAVAMGGGALALHGQPTGAGAGDGGRLVALSPWLVLAGAVLTQGGLVVAAPAIVAAVGRLGRRLPLAPRLALRDAARNRSRSGPAVAAVLGAVAGSVALTLFVASLSDHDRREYQPSIGRGQVVIHGGGGAGGGNRGPEAAVAVVRQVAPPTEQIPVRTLRDRDCSRGCTSAAVATPEPNECPLWRLEGAPPADQQAAAEKDPRCRDVRRLGALGTVVGGYDDFVRLTGLRSPAAQRALDAGGMVVFDRSQVLAGSGVLEVTDIPAPEAGRDAPPPARRVPVPAAVVDPESPVFVDAVVSPAAADRAGLVAPVSAMLLKYDDPPGDNTEERVRAALATIGDNTWFQVERGYRDAYGLGLLALLLASAVITLGAAGVATGLAQSDARPDYATLAAIGADPRLRRRLAAWQAAVVAGLGALLGTASGFVPMMGYLYADSTMRFVAPWRNLLVIALVVPAAAAVAAGGLTRSRLPLQRRLPA